MGTLTLNSVYPEWVTKGIFSYLNALEVPWKNDVSGNQLDIIYHGSRSGNKIIGSLIENYLDNNTVSDDNKIIIAQAIYTIYIKNWNALYKTLSLEYNPIENYSMTETENVQDTHKGTLESNGNNTNTYTETTIVDDTSNNQLWGFNSTDSVNSDKQTGNTTRDVGSTMDSTHKNTDRATKDITSDRTLKRSGNIGVTTSQQMIESERQLWLWNFFESVFSDIDKILVLKIY
jgi:hypothetical protein